MASAADADDAAPPAEFPSLPRELVAVVFEYIPIPMLRKAALVSRDWAAALQVDEVWHRMVLRRYALDESRAALGVLLPTWKETFIFLSEHRVPEFEMAPKFSHSCHGGLIELWATGEKARKFLLGIARGFMPTHDGLFTHHEERATPVHYRHTLGDDPLSGYSRDDGTQGYRDEKLREGLGLRKGGLRFGGVWEWSCDRVVWFPVSTTIISRGIFARSGEWSLVDTNLEIVSYLDRFPLVPFFRREVGVSTPGGFDREPIHRLASLVVNDPMNDRVYWMYHSERRTRWVNQRLIDDFERAIYSDEPTTPCVTSRLFTVHLYFRPALHLQARPPAGWSVRPQSAAQRALAPADGLYVAELLRKKIVVSAAGPFGHVNRSVWLWEHLAEWELNLRCELGCMSEADISELRPDLSPAAVLGASGADAVPGLALAPVPLDVDD